MRHFVERSRFASAAVTLVTLIAGCGRINPADENATMSLLHAGSEKVCVADDVRQALRELIVPKSGELEDANVTVENRLKGIAAIRLCWPIARWPRMLAAQRKKLTPLR